MSTSYYRLKPPFTHLKLEDAGEYNKLWVWVDGKLAGCFGALEEKTTRDVLHTFFGDTCPLRTHGAERGVVVTVNDPDLPDEAVVLSEYGELLTVAQVKARDGAKQENGMPTELFGYEEAAQALESVGFVRCQEEKRRKEVVKFLIKDIIKTTLAIAAGVIIANLTDPDAHWMTLTVAATCAIAAYEFFK